MELREYLGILRKYWAMILLIALATIFTVGAVTFNKIPQYESSTKLYVSVRSDGGGSSELVQGSNFARQVVTSYVDVVTSDLVLAPVVDELQLTDTTQELAKKVTASTPADSVLLKITTSDTDPQRAALITNAIAESFIDVVEEQLEKPIDGDASMVRLQPIQPALPNSDPVSPNKSRNLALGIVLGLMLGYGAAVLRKFLDTRIHTLSDMEELTEAPLLGAIINDPDATRHPLIVHTDPRNPRSESFRTLRTNLQFLDVQGGSRTYVISSASPSEGKTTTSINIALSLAETGSRVALIDADMRRPKIAEYMGIEGAVGLSDILIGRAELQDVAQRWGRKGSLYVLASGRIPPNPSELLGSKAMHQLMQLLDEHFDYVIIDSPPLLAVTDAVVASKYARGVILVAASSQTRKPAFEGALNRLETARANLLGIVMIRVPIKGPDSYGYGTYAYTYGEVPATNGRSPSQSRKGRHGRSKKVRA